MSCCIAFALSAYICIVIVDPAIKRLWFDIPITGLTPSYCRACPKSGTALPTPYVEGLFDV